jgi:hypothetical protein
MSKTIKVHKCFFAEYDQPKPDSCRCKWKISESDAEEMVEAGDASWVNESHTELSWNGRRKMAPRSETIEETHMERAYLDSNQDDIMRIEIYGFLTLMNRVSVGKSYLPLKLEPVGGRENDWGRPGISGDENE